MSFPPGTEMFQFPGFASAAYGFSGGYPIAEVGCPIRRSRAQSLLAAPPSFSQRATSFIASWRQGIHQMPLLSSTPASHHHRPTPPSLGLAGTPPDAGTRARARSGKGSVVGTVGDDSSDYHQRAALKQNGPHTHAR